mmetsp:Transcript_1616/g.3799  ORF Transcript_1616/g.3799 Transcript_1616/m.3799 type:complete len:204 (-) Transcript_1616:518-1129(-)
MSLPQRRAGDYMRHPRYCCGVGGVQHGELDGQAVHEVRAPLSVLHKVPPRNPLLEVVMPEGGGGVGVGGGVGEEGGHVGQHAGATFCPSANHDVPLWVPVPVQFPVPYESVPVPAVLQTHPILQPHSCQGHTRFIQPLYCRGYIGRTPLQPHHRSQLRPHRKGTLAACYFSRYHLDRLEQCVSVHGAALHPPAPHLYLNKPLR